MTRVALVNLTTTTKIGGVETFVWDLAGHLACHGIAVTVVGGASRSSPKRIVTPGVEIATVPYVDRAQLRRIPLLGRQYGVTKLLERLSFGLRAAPLLEHGAYDIIHIHKPFDFPLARRVRRRTGARILYSSHGRDFFPGDRRFTDAIDLITACSAYNATEVYKRYEREARVIYNGIDTDRFSPQPPDTLWRASVTESGAPVILWVGRMERWKGTIDALRAVALLGGIAHLVIVGDGPERSRLRDAARSLGIAERVHFLGARDHAELPLFYASADVVIGTSFANETFGMAL
ncbi:MAG: glycosyltransferase family 4 protein, partial [Thermomicrobiales bacterium]